MTTFVLTSPFRRGADVRRVQALLNRRLPDWLDRDILIDGEYGPATGSAAAAWKRYVAGYPEKMLTGGLASGLGERAQAWLATPSRIPTAWRVRASRRRRALLAARAEAAALRPVGEQAVATMLAWAQAGVREVPDGSNVVPVLQPEFRRVGSPGWIVAMGWQWCAGSGNLAGAMHGGVTGRAGVVTYDFNGLYTVAILEVAQAGRFGMQVVGASEARRGDVVLFNWPGGDPRCDHYARLVAIDHGKGLVVTVDGNIANRMGVHERSLGLVRAFIRDT